MQIFQSRICPLPGPIPSFRIPYKRSERKAKNKMVLSFVFGNLSSSRIRTRVLIWSSANCDPPHECLPWFNFDEEKPQERSWCRSQSRMRGVELFWAICRKNLDFRTLRGLCNTTNQIYLNQNFVHRLASPILKSSVSFFRRERVLESDFVFPREFILRTVV